MKGPLLADGKIVGTPLMKPNTIKRAQCCHRLPRNNLHLNVVVLLYINGGDLSSAQFPFIILILPGLLEN